ncbi:MAG: tRNA (adenosine(37)-N6)-threonylcarbamoyltransferase complex ATPase subunit type 1 TsaE [Gallionella sp.]
MTLELDGESDTLALAGHIATGLKSGMVIYLRGNLGSGKTTIVRGILESLGYKERVKSPTYTLVESYYVDGLYLRHFDLYRLQDPQEWESAGFRDEFDGSNIFFIEWPDKAGNLIPPADIEISVEITASGRTARIQAKSELGTQCLKQL